MTEYYDLEIMIRVDSEPQAGTERRPTSEQWQLRDLAKNIFETRNSTPSQWLSSLSFKMQFTIKLRNNHDG